MKIEEAAKILAYYAEDNPNRWRYKKVAVKFAKAMTVATGVKYITRSAKLSGFASGWYVVQGETK